ncbi:aldolase/citrate lyase family protein [Branchiibius sp. NY16-3462-2]|uniref:DUF6986 family protein n=1 Tax=Branchiibius sp. NY16-3462-2 TaxID=1807500 RepID=UPI00079363C0|nr:aldolase/citrate lyase family protein [Branchiibius sp. NY16-3462-2]KYH44928.1 aldolase [Branchiibius sp. NY16-3462-2]
MDQTDIVTALQRQLDDTLREADADLAARYPGDRTDRQPIHTVYVPGDRVSADLPRAWGDEALRLLTAYAPDAATLAAALGEPVADIEPIYPLIVAKLQREPIEDLRIDFEDGYGRRPDAVEDADLQSCLSAYADQRTAGIRPPWWGIRFKSFEAPTRDRGVRTLAGFLAGVIENGQVPTGLTLTLPKVTSVGQVSAMADALDALEEALGAPAGSIGFEIQVETAQAIMAPDGTAAVAAMVHAGRGRVTSLHYGTFDYSAGLGIAAAYQSLDHPVADHAKNVMQVAAAQTGVRLSDGSTNVVAFGTAEQAFATWRLHADLVQRSLVRGIYQGWDMAPGHLVSRYAATYLFFRRAFDPACSRLAAYVQRIGGDVMDEPATARMLSSALLRGIACGAFSQAEVTDRTGLDQDALTGLTR